MIENIQNADGSAVVMSFESRNISPMNPKGGLFVQFYVDRDQTKPKT